MTIEESLNLCLEEIETGLLKLQKTKSINGLISDIRKLGDFKQLILLIKNSEFAKKILEDYFNDHLEYANEGHKTPTDFCDKYLFSILLVFIDAEEFKLSKKLSRAAVKRGQPYWLCSLGRSHLLNQELYRGDQVSSNNSINFGRKI